MCVERCQIRLPQMPESWPQKSLTWGRTWEPPGIHQCLEHCLSRDGIVHPHPMDRHDRGLGIHLCEDLKNVCHAPCPCPCGEGTLVRGRRCFHCLAELLNHCSAHQPVANCSPIWCNKCMSQMLSRTGLRWSVVVPHTCSCPTSNLCIQCKTHRWLMAIWVTHPKFGVSLVPNLHLPMRGVPMTLTHLYQRDVTAIHHLASVGDVSSAGSQRPLRHTACL